MCSNFQSITRKHTDWVKETFQCELPLSDWREEIYPTYVTPFIWLKNNQACCELAQFGLVPGWAANKPRFGTRTYNARSESVSERPSYRNAWKNKQFGLAIMQGFYEPNYETGKPVRWLIQRTDSLPIAVASIWERFIDRSTGEIVFSFSMLTTNADSHSVMKRFHAPEDEKRSVIVLQEQDYVRWLQADQSQANSMLKLIPDYFLVSEPAPRKSRGKT